MPKRTYYQVLGVAEDADTEEIRLSARAMSEKFHPDRVSHRDKVLAAEYEMTLKQINEAKQCLLDPVSRQRYNNLLKHQRALTGVPNVQVVTPAKVQGQYTPGQYPRYQGPYLKTQVPPYRGAPMAQTQSPARAQVQLPREPEANVIEMELEADDDGGADIHVPRGKVAVECPGCRERFVVSEGMLGADVTCPACGVKGGCGEAGDDADGPQRSERAGEGQNGPRLTCPACGKDFKLPEGCERGDVLECPYCGVHGSLD